MKSGGGALRCGVHSGALPRALHIWLGGLHTHGCPHSPGKVRHLGRAHQPSALFLAIRGTEAPCQRGKAWPEKGPAPRVRR